MIEDKRIMKETYARMMHPRTRDAYVLPSPVKINNNAHLSGVCLVTSSGFVSIIWFEKSNTPELLINSTTLSLDSSCYTLDRIQDEQNYDL